MRLRITKSSLIIFLIFAVVVVLHYINVLTPLENLALKFLNPLGSGIYRFSQRIPLLWQEDVTHDDYTKLLEERNQLLAENIELRILEQENQALRESLNFKKENQYNTLVAKIVGRDSVSSNHFILNRGSQDGVENNLPVISPKGVLVGKIIEVEEKISVMLIPTDSRFQTAATILDESSRNTAGLVKGEKGLSIKMEFVPQDEEIEEGDIVITSGLEMNMPKGLLIGKISEVKKEAKGVFDEANISPLVSYDDLNIVMILLAT